MTARAGTDGSAMSALAQKPPSKRTTTEIATHIGVLIESDTGFPTRFLDRSDDRPVLSAPGAGHASIFSMNCSASELERLTTDSLLGVTRYEISDARYAPGATEPAMDSSGPAGEVSATPDHKPKAPQIRSSARHALVVIDDGFGFLNEAFADAGGTTRVFSLWDQGKVSASGPWSTASDLAYGAEILRADIEKLRKTVKSAADEARIYRRIGYRAAQRDATHGTHVAGCALREIAPELDCDVILVQLPRAVSVDTSGAGTPKHVLDGLLYALARVSPQANVVVNISFGALAGPHDGSTLLEQAIDGLIRREQQRRNFAVFIPAGNAFAGQCHAHIELPRGSAVTLSWQVMREDPTESFCEVWAPREGFDALKVTLRSPTGREAPIIDVARRGKTTARGPGKPITDAVLRAKHAYAGASSGLALCALAPTAPSHGGSPAAQAGTWQIELTNQGDSPMTVDAWIERDNAAMFGPYQSRQSYFRQDAGSGAQSQTSAAADVVAGHGTGNTIAHGAEVMVAGGAVGSAEVGLALADYSAMRPKGFPRIWPDVLAVTDKNKVRPGVLGLGTLSGTRVWMNGTSVAAPHAAGVALTFFARDHRLIATATLRQELLRRSIGAVVRANPTDQERAGTGVVV